MTPEAFAILTLMLTGLIFPTWLAWWNSRQLKPNGGDSIRDTIDRIDERLMLLDRHQVAESDRMNLLEQRLDDHIEHMERAHPK